MHMNKFSEVNMCTSKYEYFQSANKQQVADILFFHYQVTSHLQYSLKVRQIHVGLLSKTSCPSATQLNQSVPMHSSDDSGGCVQREGMNHLSHSYTYVGPLGVCIPLRVLLLMIW